MKSNIFIQLVRFGGVGALCFLVDFLTLLLLTEIFNMHVLLSTAIAFAVSVTLNYFLSVRFVFVVSDTANKNKNFWLFVIFSVTGLVLTEFFMKIGITIFPTVHYTITKVIVTLLVMVYNFITRKLFLEERED